MHAVQDHYADPILDSMGGREIIIDNRDNSNAHEDYQVELEIKKSHLFFAEQDGLRFVDENLKIIDQWGESFPDKEWLEVPRIQASTMCSSRMLDGTPSIGSSSDGIATFILYENFEDVSDWTLDPDTYATGAQQTDYKEEGTYSYKLYGISGGIQEMSYAYLTENDSFDLPASSKVRFWYKVHNDALYCGCYFQISPDKSSWTTLWSKGTSVNETGTVEIDLSSYSGVHYFRFYNASGGGSSGRSSRFWFDGLRVRNYSSPEPTAEIGVMV